MRKKMINVLVITSNIRLPGERSGYTFVFDEVLKLVEKYNIRALILRIKPGILKHENILIHDLFAYPALKYLPETLEFFKKWKFFLKYYPPHKRYFLFHYTSLAIKLVKKYRIDLIHSHFAFPEGLIGVVVAMATGKPLIITVHGYDVIIEPSIGYGIRLYEHYDLVIREILNKADVIIVSSTCIKNTVERIVYNKRKIIKIPLGVDIKRFSPTINNRYVKAIRRIYGLNELFIIFSPKNHFPVYGIEYLIRAFYEFSKERKESMLLLGGEGPLTSHFKKMIRSYNLVDKVIFLGMIPHEIINYYYAASDVIVVPSLQEGFGLVVAEALATGKPVVASNVCGIRDQIVNMYNGILVSPKNHKEILDNLLMLAEDVELRKQLGLNARFFAEKYLNIDSRASSIYKVYNNLLENGKYH